MATERNRRPERPQGAWSRPRPEVRIERRQGPQAGPVSRRDVLAKGALAGLIAGAAMGLYLMLFSALAGWGFWNPLNAIGSTLAPFPAPVYPTYLGHIWEPGGLPMLAAFQPLQTLVGLLLHLAVSVAVGILFAFVLTRFRMLPTGTDGETALVGTVGGMAVWAILGLLVATALNPVMQIAPPPVAWSTAHVLFGIVAALLVRRWLPTTPKVRIAFAREDQADRVVVNDLPRP